MIRKAAKDSAVYIASVFLTRGINILLLPFYTRVLTPLDYGHVDLMYTLAAIVNLVLALEVTQAIARFLPDLQDRSRRILYVSSAHWFTIGVYAIFAIMMLLWQQELKPSVLSTGVSDVTYLLGVLSISIQGPFNYLTNLLKWSLRAKANAAVSLITSLVIISVSLPAVLFFDFGIAGIFLGNLVGNMVGIIIAWTLVRQDIRVVFDWSLLKELINYSGPLVFSGAAIFISLYIDRIFLKIFHNATTVGLYGIAFRFASLVHLFVVGLQTAITPLILNHYKNPDTPAKIEQMVRFYMVLTAFIVVGLTLFSKEVLILFTSPEYYPAWPAIPLLALALLLSNSYFLAPGLSIEKKTKTIALISISSAVANVGLNFVLIPAYDIVGAAVATAASGALSLFLYFGWNQKYLPLPIEQRRYGLYTLVVSTYTAGIVIVYLAQPNLFTLNYTHIILKSCTLLVVTSSVLIILFSKNELRIIYLAAQLFLTKGRTGKTREL